MNIVMVQNIHKQEYTTHTRMLKYLFLSWYNSSAPQSYKSYINQEKTHKFEDMKLR